MRYLVKQAMPRTLWSQCANDYQESSRSPRVNIREQDEAYYLEAELPGLSEDQLTVEVKDNLLILSADTSKDEKEYLLKERTPWSFKRSFVLPKDVDANKIQASFHQGMLELELKKKPESKPKKIQIKSKG